MTELRDGVSELRDVMVSGDSRFSEKLGAGRGGEGGAGRGGGGITDQVLQTQLRDLMVFLLVARPATNLIKNDTVAKGP